MVPFLYWLVEGNIEVSFPDGSSKVFGQGLIGGENYLLFGVRTNFTIVAVTNCSIMKLESGDFFAIPGILHDAVEMRQKAALRLIVDESQQNQSEGLY